MNHQRASRWLAEALRLPDNATPFPWQERMLAGLLEGDPLPRSVDLATGLGKTSVMAIWLVARAAGADVPRRLVYVVDRRAVVDQATEVALHLRSWVERCPEARAGLGLPPQGSLPISTLRGQHADNREWLEDPSAPAIVVGTVDMIGSRLLFGGYGVSPKMRPYHAGLLGNDSLIVLDESHLVPPFDALLEWVADAAEVRGKDAPMHLPPMHFMRLSATAGGTRGSVFRLAREDEQHPEVKRRLDARKALVVRRPELAGIEAKKKSIDKAREELLVEHLAEEAAALATENGIPRRVLVYCNRRKDAQSVAKHLEKRFTVEREDEASNTGRKRKKPKVLKIVEADIELFVGGRRVRERQAAAERLAALGLLAGQDAQPPSSPTFLVATSAAEVGVDLDADHMVCDLVAWERMVQRLGRVNRRGRGKAEVRVVLPASLHPQISSRLNGKDAEAEQDLVARIEQWLEPIRALPTLGSGTSEGTSVRDASPGALIALSTRAASEPELAARLDMARSAPPLRPPLSRALLDAWSMTSLKEHPGRPHPGPWLRGWVDDQPQVSVAWRAVLPCDHEGRSLPNTQAAAFFEAAPMHLTERLETEAIRICSVLGKRAESLCKELSKPGPTPPEEQAPFDEGSASGPTSEASPAEPPSCELVSKQSLAAVLLDTKGETHVYSLQDVATWKSGKGKDRASVRMAGGQLFVHAAIGGLRDGLLDEKATERVLTADDLETDWLPVAEPKETLSEPVVRWRVRLVDADFESRDPGWHERLRLPYHESEEGDVLCWWLIEKWRHDAATEEDRSAAYPQLLDEHLEWTADDATRIAHRLGLQEPWRTVLTTAAKVHDLGKRAPRWQRAFHAPPGGIYAKTLGPVGPELLEGYRHELGTILEPEGREALAKLANENKEAAELATHMVLAHHGYARPLLPWTGCDQAPPSRTREVAREAALRFVELQRTWGPWGLAWWEALLRAADQQASRRNDARAKNNGSAHASSETSGGTR